MDSRTLRRFLTIVAPVFAAVLFVTVGTALVASYDSRSLHRTLESVADAGRQGINDAVRQDILILESIRAYWLGSNEVTKEEFGVYSASLTRSFRGLHAIQWVDPQNIVRYVYPLEGENLKSVDFDNNPYPNRLAPIMKAKETRTAIVSKPLMLVQGFPGIIVYLPIFRGEEYLGAAVGVIKLETLLGSTRFAVRAYGSDGYVDAGGTVITLDGTEIYGADGKRIVGLGDEATSGGQSPSTYPLYATKTLAIPVADSNWRLFIGLRNSAPFKLPTVLSMLMGMFFVSLLAGTLVLFDRKAEEMRKLAARERDFVSLVSHQLRLPLTQLSWILDSSFADERLSKEQKDAINDMGTIVRGSVKIVTDLLNVSRIDRGVLKLDSEEMPAAVLVDEALLPFKKTESSRKVSLSVDIPVGLHVYVDRQKTVEALRNIVDNAIKYSPEGSLVKVTATEAEEGMIRIVIRDNGKGIPKDLRDHIFEKSTVYAKKGTGEGAGLGLYLSKQFIELMGGSITFETSERGTSFFVTLPSEKKS